jgi:hypothetical protein
MLTKDEDGLVGRAELRDLANLVDVDRLRDLLTPATRRWERVSRSYAGAIAGGREFPPPLIDHPRLRLWLMRDVESWLDRHRPGWREPGRGRWADIIGPQPDGV